MRLRRHPWAVSLAATVAVLGLVEFGFRVAGVPAFHPEDLLTELDAFRLVRTRAGLRLHGPPWNVAITTNRLGFRVRETTVAKPAGLFRVVALGDSSTFGVCVGDDETFCAQAERLLNADARAGRRVEVINAGVIGYNTMQGLRTLQRVILPLQPDCVVVSFAVNDSAEGGQLRNYLGRHRPELETLPPAVVSVRNLLWNHSAVCRWLLRDFFAGQAYLDRVREAGVKAGWKPGSSEDYRRNLEEIVRIARAHGIAVVFMPMPVRLKHTLFPLYEINYVILHRSDARKALAYMDGVIAKTPDPHERSAMWLAVARLREGMGDARGALDAYLTAMSLSDLFRDLRWGAYTYANLMAGVAATNRVPLVNVLPAFYRRELSDNPPELYADGYHPGTLGHRIIAEALAATIRDLMRRK